MLTTHAVFFDGVTSYPHQGEVVLDTGSGVLELRFLALSLSWKIREITFQQVGNNIEIQCKTDPVKILKVDNPVFIRELKLALKMYDNMSLYHRMLDWGIQVHITLAAVIIGVIALVYFFILPEVAERAAVLVPESYETQMGNSFWNSFEGRFDVDTTKSRILQTFANQMNLKNTKKIQFFVVESETVNAFALPNGNIVVFTGIIDKMKNYEELAGLIGHETAHVNNRHSVKMMCRNLAGYLFLSAVISDVNGIIAVIGDNINSLNSLTYSRTFEKEADIEGIHILAINQIDPNGMLTLFQHMQDSHSITLPEFISSHPLTTHRISYIKDAIAANPFKYAQNEDMRELFVSLQK